MHRRTGIRLALLTLALAALAVVPAGALADDLPDAIDDPIAAVAPDPDPAPAPAPEKAVGGVEAPEVAIAVEPEVPGTAHVVRTVRAPRATTQGPTASLPFTGSDSRQLVLLLLVGLVAGCAGAVSLAWARAADDTV